MILDSHVGYAPRTIVQIMRWLIRMIRYAERTLHGYPGCSLDQGGGVFWFA